MSKGADTRQQIVASALDLASSVGMEGLTLGTLAEKLGLSKSGLFAHFKSKEHLQLEVLEEVVRRFIASVIQPALSRPRGEPRLQALFEADLQWTRACALQGGCLLLSLSYEYDDRPGPVRELLVRSQRDWLGVLARAARIAMEEGHFRTDLDPDQFAYELQSLFMGYQYNAKLLGDGGADKRLRTAFERLLADCRATRSVRLRRPRSAVRSL